MSSKMKKDQMQILFDKSAFHLLTQKRKSVTPQGCSYRGLGGTMCAVGCLIPDELYDEKLEGINWCGVKHPPVCSSGTLQAMRAVYNHINPTKDGDIDDLLMGLQIVHDMRAPTYWPEELRKLARKYKLKTSIIELAEVLTKEYEL